MTQSVAPSDLRRDLVALLPRLRRFALAQAGSLDEADNLVREVCLQAVSKGRIDGYGDRLDVRLFRLILEQFAGTAGNKYHASRAIAGNQTSSGSCPKAHQLVVLDMPRDLRSVFLLVEVEGISQIETAGILDLTVEKVASCLCEARLYFADFDNPLAERRA